MKTFSFFRFFVLFCFGFSFLNGEEKPKLHTIVILDKQEDITQEKPSLQNLKGVHLLGSKTLKKKELFQENLEKLFLGNPLNEKLLLDLKNYIAKTYEENGSLFVAVSTPEQNLSNGILQILVEEPKVGKVDVVGNRWAPIPLIRNYIKLKPGDFVHERILSKNLDFMNRNPFRRVSLILDPKTDSHTVDLTFDVEGRKPYRFYVGTDNTGIPTTERQRAFAGFSWDQMFGFDQTLLYQYTTSYDFKSLQAHTLQYTAFTSIEHILNLYGGYSKAEADISFPNRTNKGRNYQASFRYIAPFLPLSKFAQEMVFGFDWKNTNNNIQYIDALFPVFSHVVNLTQFTLGYKCSYLDKKNEAVASFSLFTSPFEWFPNQTPSDFENLRPGATNTWIYFDGSLIYKRWINRFQYVFSFFGKVSNNPLLPSEQLGIGGISTVRGYDERQLNVDAGIVMNHELYLPSTPVFNRKGSNQDQLQFLCFVDMGGGSDYKLIPTIQPRNYLLSTGGGLRYYFSSYFTARLDVGLKLHHKAAFTGGNPMFHFSVIGSY